jgi:tetratricopeptide (TPR) repeat protein
MSSKAWLLLVPGLLWGVGGCAGRAKEPYAVQVKKVESLADRGDEQFLQGDFVKAGRDYRRALEMSRGMDYQGGVARQLNNLGALALEEGKPAEARELFTRAYELNREQGRLAEASTNQANLATVAEQAGDRAQAARHLTLAEEAARASGRKEALARIYIRWAGLALEQQDHAGAEHYLNLAAPLAKTPDLKAALAHQQGRLALQRGDTATALAAFTQALDQDRAVLDRAAMAADLFYLGETCRLRRDWPRAFDYYSRAFDVYAALKRQSRLRECLERLREAQREGGLTRDLERFEKQFSMGPTAQPHGGK